MTTNDRSISQKQPAAAIQPHRTLVTAVEQLSSATEALRQQSDALAGTGDAAERQQQRYLAVLDFLPDAYFVTDVQGRIREANHATSSLIGFARRYCIGKPLRSLLAREDAERLAVAMDRASSLRAGGVHETELRFRPRRQAGPVTTAIRVAAIRDPRAGLMGFRWLVRDVTAERAIADELQTLKVEQEARLRARTAELEAIVKMQAALIEQDRAARGR